MNQAAPARGKAPPAGNPLIGSDRVHATMVRRPDGTKIGQIERLMIDKMTGKVAYAVMSFGGFLGLGGRYYTLPWMLLDYNPDLDAYELDISRADLESAPELTPEGELGADRKSEAALHEHYDTKPYW